MTTRPLRRSVGAVRKTCAAVLAGVLAAVAAGLGFGGGVPRAAPASGAPALSFSIAHVRPALPARRDTFFSIYPACACGRRTVIGQFSRSDGRLVRTLATISVGGGSHVSNAATDARGGMWMAFTAGPALAAPGTAGGGPEPNTCMSALVRFDLRTGAVATVMRFPASVTLGNAVPSPDGRRVAVLEGGCATAFFNQHIVVVDVATGRQIHVGADATPCHSLFKVAWSPDGTRLLFPFGPSSLPRGTHFLPAGTCQMPQLSRLVVVSALRPSGVRAWRLWKADPHCSYEAAAFDHTGVAAAEGCARRGGPFDTNLGPASLVQLDAHGRRLARFPLAAGFEDGDVVRDPLTGRVLVSEDQPANSGLSDDQWVFEFDGRGLRTVVRRPALDATLLLAQPW